MIAAISAAQVTRTPSGTDPSGTAARASTSTVFAIVLATRVEPTSAGRKLKTAA